MGEDLEVDLDLDDVSGLDDDKTGYMITKLYLVSFKKFTTVVIAICISQ